MLFSLGVLVVNAIFIYLLGLPLICIFRRKRRSIAFFHPYCNAGGGGERVLWRAIAILQNKLKNDWKIIVYMGDVVQPHEIIANAQSRFNISIDMSSIEFVYLRSRKLIEPFPYCTMFLQMFGGLWLGVEALYRYTPELFIDSTGVPLTLPLFRYVGGCKVGAYVHYPTITHAMINVVRSRQSTYNNCAWIAKTRILTSAKIFYYRDLTELYKFCGRSADFVMTNGSWTNAHISELWSLSDDKQSIVFPPCDIELLSALDNTYEELFDTEGRIQILSVGQIRPEKNHELQLAIFSEACRLLREENLNYKLELIVAGGCRNQEDIERLENLKHLATDTFHLKNDVDVKWRVNISFSELTELLQSSMIGLHTMWNEHFGISVVEGLSAGSIMIAHNSAGPKQDIIGGFKSTAKNKFTVCGFLAETKEEYARIIIDIIKMGKAQRRQIRENARESANRFSNFEFDRCFFSAITSLIAK